MVVFGVDTVAHAAAVADEDHVEVAGISDAGHLNLVGNLFDKRAGLQVHHVEGVVRLVGDKQAAASRIHGQMVEVADCALEFNRLDEYEWVGVGSPSRCVRTSRHDSVQSGKGHKSDHGTP